MRTVALGGTGVEVSVFCLGTMYFGSSTDAATSYRLLDQYVEAGGSFLDTANIYARWVPGYVGGESETLLGRWMRERNTRSQLILASKVGFEMPGVEQGLRARQIEEECEKSLKRLGVDTIDVYYAHCDDRNTPVEETVEAFDKLVKKGKVRFIGASNFSAWRLEEARWVSRTHGWTEYCCIQQRYSYVRPKPGADFDPQVATNEDLLDYCKTRGITLLAYSPLLRGAYTRADRPFPEQYIGPDTKARVAVLKDIAEEKKATPNQVVFAWMIHSESCVIPLVAASTTDQMRENLGALNVRLSVDDMARLNNASA